MSGKIFRQSFLMSGKKIFTTHPLSSARQQFWGKYGLRNRNFLQGIIGFGRAILADTSPIKRG
jgi:hypothetical protein